MGGQLTNTGELDAHAICEGYFQTTQSLMKRVMMEERDSLRVAADSIADRIAEDRLVYTYGPGGHSNLAVQDVFFRAGGLTHISAILDEGTLLSNGALRSLSIERLPGYGKAVIANQSLSEGDLLVVVSAYGVNSTVIEAAQEARLRGVTTIGLNSHEHALSCAPDHPARHPGRHNLQDIVDIAIDTKMPPGDSALKIPGMSERTGAVSSFTNLFTLHCLMLHTMAALIDRGIDPPVWRSANASGGDQANAQHVEHLKDRVRWL